LFSFDWRSGADLPFANKSLGRLADWQSAIRQAGSLRYARAGPETGA
jgi:hypothetical protein